MATILVVDDRPSNRQYLTTLLGYGGHRLLEAADGAQALELVRAQRPDLVITDILMPKMDGYEFVQRVRADPEIARLPVIFYTASYSTPQAEALAKSCGVQKVLAKPAEPQAILSAVNAALGLSDRDSAAPEGRDARAEPVRPLDDSMSLYLKDLQEVRSRFEDVIRRSTKLRSERESIKDLSEKFAENVASMQRVTTRLSALIEVGMEMTTERDPGRLVELFFAAACDLVDSDYAAVGVLDKSEQAVRFLFAKGFDADLLKGDAAHDGLLASLLRGQRVLRPRGAKAARGAGGLPAGHPEVLDLLGIPVVAADRVYGWIYFANSRDAAGFGDEDVRVITVMSRKLALLYENAMLYDAIQSHDAQLQIEIGERWRAEEARVESEARLRAIFEGAAVGIVHSDLNGRVLMVNPTFAEITGYAGEEMPTLSLRDLTHPEDLQKSLDSRAQLSAGTMKQYERETRLIRKDGQEIWTSITTSPVVTGKGKPSYFISIIRDISERRRMEQELRRFRLALDKSADMVFIIDRATMRIVDVNDTACRLLGYTREELLRMGPQDTLPVSREQLEKNYDELIATPSLPGGMQSYYRCKDGSRLPFESTRHVLRSGDAWLIAAVSRDMRERIAKEQALRESEAGLRRAQVMAKLGHVVTGSQGAFVSWSETLPELVGLSPDQFPKTTSDWLNLIHPEDRTLFRDRAIEAGATHARTKVKYRLRRADGAWIHVRQTMDPLRGGRDTEPRWFNTIQDVTEQREAEEKIGRLNRVYAVLSGINSLIVRVRDRDELVKEACRVAVEVGGFRMAWIGMVDKKTSQVTPVAWHGGSDDYIRRMPVGLKDAGREGQGLSARAVRERRAISVDDMTQDARIQLRGDAAEHGFRSLVILPLMVEEEVAGVLALYAGEVAFFDDQEMKLLLELAGDISFALDHIQKAEKLDYLAYYDPLTGLPNRTLFQEHLEQFLHAAEREQHKVALLIFDLERFKSINDTLGRQTGDALLKQVAERLVKSRGDPTRVARLSADHFALVLPRVRSDDELARRIENRFEEIFGRPFKLGESEVLVSAKLGLALYPQDAADGETLFKNAEAALKKAKSSGERYLFYTEEMTKRVAEKLTLENKLRRALDNEEFVLYYQPKVELEKRTIVGVEALIRWQSPELGLVPPLKFIPLMEETGLILQVGAWALRRAALEHKNWVEAGLNAPRVAVNVSSLQLRQRDFVKVLQEAILEGVSPAGIDLEITESLIMEDIRVNIEKLLDVRKLGVGVAIDDFGTGYSSLAYLARLPVETLKIDRAFIITMLDDPNTATLVQTMITLAHSFRLKVVAEGVETEEQAKMLRLLRCDQMQGYLFSKPVPRDAITAMLQK
ncbi:MAG TPA: EAL domain-containing protein [Burkholderiales bacterium]|nr:EAL domain-containing protein [Burkholderiales bacterium]